MADESDELDGILAELDSLAEKDGSQKEQQGDGSGSDMALLWAKTKTSLKSRPPLEQVPANFRSTTETIYARADALVDSLEVVLDLAGVERLRAILDDAEKHYGYLAEGVPQRYLPLAERLLEVAREIATSVHVAPEMLRCMVTPDIDGNNGHGESFAIRPIDLCTDGEERCEFTVFYKTLKRDEDGAAGGLTPVTRFGLPTPLGSIGRICADLTSLTERLVAHEMLLVTARGWLRDFETHFVGFMEEARARAGVESTSSQMREYLHVDTVKTLMLNNDKSTPQMRVGMLLGSRQPLAIASLLEMRGDLKTAATIVQGVCKSNNLSSQLCDICKCMSAPKGENGVAVKA